MTSSRFIPFPILTTERLTLRKLSVTDKYEIFLLRSNEIVNKYIDRPRPVNISEAVEFIEKINKGIDEGKNIYWAIGLRESPELIGAICLWNFSSDYKVAEIGYELNPLYQGFGLMHEAFIRVVRYAFEILSLDRMEAFTQERNAKSLALLEKNNFVLEPDRTDEDHLLNRIYSLRK